MEERLLRECEARSADRDAQIEPARDAFYRGFLAEAIDRFYRTARLVDSSGQPYPGLLRGDDLAVFAATTERTVSRHFPGVTVPETGPGPATSTYALPTVALPPRPALLHIDGHNSAGTPGHLPGGNGKHQVR